MRGTIDGSPSRLTLGKVVAILAATFGLVLISSSCTGSAKVSECKATASNPDGCLYSQMANQLEAAAGTHYELLKAAGRAHASGLLSDSQLEKVRTAGKQLELALRAARSALATARAMGSDAPFAAFANVQEALADLSSLVGAFR